MFPEQSGTNTLAAELARLREDYLKRLPYELNELQTLANALTPGETAREGLINIYHRLHRLAGIPPQFNLQNLSTQARILEQQIKIWLSDSLDKFDKATFDFLIKEIDKLPIILQNIISKTLNT